MRTTEEHTELAQMAEQMKELKDQLARQRIVTETMLKQAMKSKMNWLKRMFWLQLALAPIAVSIWYFIKEFAGLSWGCYGFMVVMIVIECAVSYRINVAALTESDYSSSNLVNTIQKLLHTKRLRAWQMVIEVPLLVIWFIWVGVEGCLAFPENASDIVRGAFMVGGVGLVIGSIAGLCFSWATYRKMQRTSDEVIEMIRSLTQP